MTRRQLSSALAACVLVVGVVAIVDAARSRDGLDRPARARTDTRSSDPATSPTGALESKGIRGVLYYSDREDDCRVHAVRLPTLEAASSPKGRACRFQQPSEPGASVVDVDAVWQPRGSSATSCAGGRVSVSTQTDDAVGETEGCAPAWKPDRTLTVIRDGEVWGTTCLAPEAYARRACWRKLLATAELTQAARALPFVPTAPRFLRSVEAIRVAWFSETRAAVLVRVRLRGRLRALGPVAVLAFYEGTRLVRATQYAGAFDLRMSRRRSFVGVVERSGQIAIVGRGGSQLLGPANLPSPSAHAVAWSPDERWAAIATRWSVYLVPTSDLVTDRQPRIIRLPLVVGDLAWR